MATLTEDIGPATNVLTFDTPISVGSYPAPFTLDSENIQVIGGDDYASVSVVRGTNGTAPASHTSGTTLVAGWGGSGGTLDAVLAASTGEDIADALSGAASPDAANVFATIADIPVLSADIVAALGAALVPTAKNPFVTATLVSSTSGLSIGLVDPHVSGVVWRDVNTLKVSAG